MYDDLFGSVDMLNKGIQATWLRNKVINNNIANVDTVGFKASEVEFESMFSDALGSTPVGSGIGLSITNEKHFGSGGAKLSTNNERHISTGGAGGTDPVVVTDEDTSLRYDENNVDIEHEMVELAKNSIEYYALVNKVNSEFTKLNTAINID